ncbi:MAG: hypothetical protein JWR75_1446 [Devosia sp.]|nr:hypothetical protein [Devosia sp.]
MKALVVEDEWLIAIETCSRLDSLGCEILGPASTCEEALDLIDQDRPDFALLDTTLGEETSRSVFYRCVALGIPTIIVSGHMRRDLPDFCIGAPYISKPIEQNRFDGVIRAYLGEMA